MSILRVLSLKKEFSDIANTSSNNIENIQKTNKKKLIDYVKSNSKFYSKLYDKKDISNFENLPMTNKKLIMDNFTDVITNKHMKLDDLEYHIHNTPVGTKYKDEYKIIHTSGSSGTLGIFTYDSIAWDTLKALILSRCTNFKLGLKRKRMAFIGAIEGHNAGVTLASDVPRIMAAYTQVSVNEPTENIVKKLNKFRPDDIRGYPSGISILASEKLSGRLNIKPNNIVSSAEPLDNQTKNLIEEAFGITPYNFYAASESIGIAQDCSEHCGLHVFNDQYVLEIVDEKGNPVERGKSGNVLLTNLYNKCQPIIRYKMNDIASYSEDECDCGSPFPLLKTVEGRKEEAIWVENEKGNYDIINPLIFVEFFVPGLRKLQVHQIQRNKLRLYVVINGNKDNIKKSIKKKMDKILSGKNLINIVDYEIDVVSEILPNKKTGKTKTVISMGMPKL